MMPQFIAPADFDPQYTITVILRRLAAETIRFAGKRLAAVGL
jgi:hypothetical protein